MEGFKSKILKKAAEMYQQFGIKSISIDDVSRALGISKKIWMKFLMESENAIKEMLSVNYAISSFLNKQTSWMDYYLEKYYSETFCKLEEENETNMNFHHFKLHTWMIKINVSSWVYSILLNIQKSKKIIQMKRTALLILGFLLSVMATGQEVEDVLEINIEQAKTYAIEHNKSVKSMHLEYVKSDFAVKEAIGQGLPQISASMDYNTYFNYEAEFSFSEGSQISDDQIQYLDQLFAAGSLQDQTLWAFTRPQLVPSEPMTVSMDGQSSANIQLSQLIFNGQYWTGIQLAKIGRELNRKNLQKSELDISNTVANSYYLTLITEKSSAIIDSNMVNLNKTLIDTEAMYTVGMAEITDVDQIKMALTRLENAKRSLERNIELNYNLLRLQLGVAPGTELILKSSLDEILMASNFEKLLITEFQMENNIDYQLMEDQEALSETMLKTEKWAYGPTLSGFYQYTKKIITTEFDMNPPHVAGLTLSLPLYNGGANRSRVKQAKIELNQASLNKSLVEDQLKLTETQLRFNLRNAYENYLLQKENVVLAQRVNDNIDRKFKGGILSSLDLTLANDNYLTAENNYLTSIMELLQAKQELENLLTQVN